VGGLTCYLYFHKFISVIKIKQEITRIALTALVLVSVMAGCRKTDSTISPVSDIDGNSYRTIRIGDQIWMAENLKTSKFADGEVIPEVRDSADWCYLVAPALCWYDNDQDSYKDLYGALYNFYTVSTGKLCPEGWHVPTKDEWQQLIYFLGDTLSGGKLKEQGTLHWNDPNTGAINSAGFSALPAGIRYLEGTFASQGYFTAFWSANEADTVHGWYSSLYYRDALTGTGSTPKRNGLSVRCVRN
jgi:uncharacterized protein (TIGR02145 family)